MVSSSIPALALGDAVPRDTTTNQVSVTGTVKTSMAAVGILARECRGGLVGYIHTHEKLWLPPRRPISLTTLDLSADSKIGRRGPATTRTPRANYHTISVLPDSNRPPDSIQLSKTETLIDKGVDIDVWLLKC